VTGRHGVALPGTLPQPQTISVVVPTFRRPESLERCLYALGRQVRRADQVVVVARSDDEVTRSACAALRNQHAFEFVQTRATALADQMATGGARAWGDVVAFTDDDAAPRVGWLGQLLRHYDDPTVGGVGGRDVILRYPADRGPARRRRVGVVTASGRLIGEHHLVRTGARSVDFLKGVNLSVRRALWHIDTGLVGIGNQTHWELGTCLRIRSAGWRLVYDPEILVDHYVADRIEEPQRGSTNSYTVARDAHNELYELVRWLPAWHAAIATARALLVGSRAAPGLASAAWLASRGSHRRDIAARTAYATSGRMRALCALPRRHRWDQHEEPSAEDPVACE